MTQRLRLSAGIILAMGTAIASGSVAGDGSQGDPAPPATRRAETPPVDFARDVRPILSDNCFACHGPDENARKAGLRLDLQEGALGQLGSGGVAVVAGDPDESELIFRVETDDPEAKMPPPGSGKELSPDQIDLLRRWVEQGAPWTAHWAFVPPRKPELPAVSQRSWPRNPIDWFILARLEAEGLRPSPEADRATLIRRVALDLTGLPPTAEEVEAFLDDSSPEGRAYEELVDRLLASPRFGEHMARFWLDAARYGDTHGLHLDNYREIWPYRDWVIKAFNGNKPFDQFIVEQLAGDLLPNPTLEQLIATGFNRCHVSTAEGGSIEEEVYVRNVTDQVDTNGTVFLGLTIGCARCHDHKYDPIRMKDYYQLFAFFNNIDGPPMDGNSARWAPTIQVPTVHQKAELEKAERRIAEVRRRLAEMIEKAVAAYDRRRDDGQSEIVQRADYFWMDDALPVGATPQGSEPWDFVMAPDYPVRHGSAALRLRVEGIGQRAFLNPAVKLKLGDGDTFIAHVYLDPLQPPRAIMLQWHSGGAWNRRAYWGENVFDHGQDGTPERLRVGDLPPSGKWVRLEVETHKLDLKPGSTIEGLALTQAGGTAYWDAIGLETWTPQEGQRYDSLTAWIRARRADGGAGLSESVKAALNLDRGQRTEPQIKELLAAFVERGFSETHSQFEPLHAELAEAERERQRLDEQIPTSLIFRERSGEPKPAYVLHRGEYDQRREEVRRSTPAFLPPLPAGAPLDRLGLARWLVDESNPLTARVAVNRLWLQIFGNGLVRTAEDFGAQGEPPSHPELLDWLAVQFREDGWDVKRFLKRLVTSSTYRQSSRATPEVLARDPNNRLLARGPRFRLDAETLRDQALFLGGLLYEQIGGPSVKPPQPSGLWEAVGYTSSNTAKFTPDRGVDKVHRRSLYTFWKRTAAPPQMTTLDAPSRESCVVRRERTNTPLQALMLLNEVQYIEAARGMAQRVLQSQGLSTTARLELLFRMATARAPAPDELADLEAALRDFQAHYQRDPAAAQALIFEGESKPDPGLDPQELAPWTVIGNVILNLDEVVTKG